MYFLPCYCSIDLKKFFNNIIRLVTSGKVSLGLSSCICKIQSEQIWTVRDRTTGCTKGCLQLLILVMEFLAAQIDLITLNNNTAGCTGRADIDLVFIQIEKLVICYIDIIPLNKLCLCNVNKFR